MVGDGGEVKIEESGGVVLKRGTALGLGCGCGCEIGRWRRSHRSTQLGLSESTLVL